MRVLARLIEDPFDIPIERPEYPNTRHHSWSILLGDKNTGMTVSVEAFGCRSIAAMRLAPWPASESLQ